MRIKEFIEETFIVKQNRYVFRPRIICNDGFTISVQASEGHYCHPRRTQNWYNSVELGYPSIEEELITEFAENKDILTETVYGYVPCDVVDKVIEKHGGINKEKTFERGYSI